MSRKKTDYKRRYQKDSKYKNIYVTKFINRLMTGGKKSVAA